MNYNEFVLREVRGEILIGVEPAIARRFFTDKLEIYNEIDEKLTKECFFVKAFLILEYGCLIAGIIAGMLALKWYSIIAIPLMIIASFVLGGVASVGRQKIGTAVFFVFVGALLAYYFRDYGMYMVVWLIQLPLPYFFARLTYKLASIFLRELVVRSEKAYNLLIDKGIFLKESQ